MIDEPVTVERGLLTSGAKAWDLAVRRAAVLGPLAEQETVGLAAADVAAAELGVSRRQVYELVRRWRAGEAWPRTCCRAVPAAGGLAGGFPMRSRPWCGMFSRRGT